MMPDIGQCSQVCEQIVSNTPTTKWPRRIATCPGPWPDPEEVPTTVHCKRTTDLQRSRMHPDDRAMLDLYVVAMQRRNLSPATIENRVRRVELIGMEYRVAGVTTEQIATYLDELDIGPRTRYTWVSHLGCFYKLAVAQDHLAKNPIAKIMRPKMGRLLPKPTPRDEVDLALAKAPTPILRAWITLAAYAGVALRRDRDIAR